MAPLERPRAVPIQGDCNNDNDETCKNLCHIGGEEKQIAPRACRRNSLHSIQFNIWTQLNVARAKPALAGGRNMSPMVGALYRWVLAATGALGGG